MSTPTARRATQLRVHLLVQDLQPQFAAWLGTPTRARGYPPYAGQHALFVEVAPGLAIHRIADLALRAAPAVEPGILFVERQFGVLEVHGDRLADVEAASRAILDGIGAGTQDALAPDVLYSDVIDDVTDTHAVIVNRTREASMLLPGQSLLVHEVTPALFAALGANEAEKAAPGVTLVDVSMIGAAGRLYLGGSARDVAAARDALDAAFAAPSAVPAGSAVPTAPDHGRTTG